MSKPKLSDLTGAIECLIRALFSSRGREEPFTITAYGKTMVVETTQVGCAMVTGRSHANISALSEALRAVLHDKDVQIIVRSYPEGNDATVIEIRG